MTQEDIFSAALEAATPEARAALLERACAGDSVLRNSLEALLEAHDRAGSFLEHPAVHVPEQPVSVPDATGTTVGPYRLLQRIGEGGMGTVFMAEQTSPVRRKVAVKILRSGMGSGTFAARFEAERQAIALMDHPNIARVYDAGTTGERPYFVMELIQGVPITAHCDRDRLSIPARLELFVSVCHAVQHAHQKGLIHRDLKPSNVLVAQYDGVAVPKVIDFGLVKATGTPLTDHTLFTEFGQVMGTPEYMSPEQARLDQVDVDTRSDVYSLGVILYELVTGTTPLERSRLGGQAFLEVLRRVREEEPPTPSSRLSTSDRLPRIAANRDSAPKRLSGFVRGDLDWIVMKCLERRRERRYETANALAVDLRRFLAHEPVLASPPSALHKLRKFVRRRRTSLAIGGLFVAFLAVIGTAFVWRALEGAARRGAIAGEVSAALVESLELQRRDDYRGALIAVRRADSVVAGDPALADLARATSERRSDLEMVARLEDIRVAGPPFGRARNPVLEARYRDAFRDYGIDVEATPPELVGRWLRERSVPTALALGLDLWAVETRRENAGDWPWAHLLLSAASADPDPSRDVLRRALLARPESEVDGLRRLAVSSEGRVMPPQHLEILGCLLVDVGAIKDAVVFLRDAVFRHPDEFWLNSILSRALIWSVGDPEESLRCAFAAVALRPSSAHAHSIMGGALLNKRAYGGAIAELTRARELDPRNETTLLRRGIAKLGLHDVAAAAADFREALGLAPSNDYARFFLFLADALGEPGEVRARGTLEEGLAERGGPPIEGWTERVDAYLRGRIGEQALEDAALPPPDPYREWQLVEAYFYEGSMAWIRGDEAAGRALLERAVGTGLGVHLEFHAARALLGWPR